MKKLVALLLCCLMIFTGCGKTPSAVPNIGTDGSAATDPVWEGELDFSDLPGSQSATDSNTAPSQPAGTVSEPPTTAASGTPSSQPTGPAAETTEPSAETTEPSAETTAPPTEMTEPIGTTAPVKDAEGYYNQVVRP